MQPATSPEDRAGTCKSPESQCIRVQVQSPRPKPSSTAPFETITSSPLLAQWWHGG